VVIENIDRFFWAFTQTLTSIPTLSSVLSIDDTFLTGKYKNTLLMVIATYTNNLLPIACALVESDNKDVVTPAGARTRSSPGFQDRGGAPSDLVKP